MHIVKPTDKPTSYRLQCPTCGPVMYSFTVTKCPERSLKTGKIRRRGQLKVDLCVQCLINGKKQEVGR